ncbi:GH36-type glycosyl hydrolase domain-containing protein [Clostridium sp. LBM24168]
MLYIIILMGIVLILLSLYIIFDKLKYKPENVLEDINLEDENKEELKRHAHKISSVSSEVMVKSCRRKLIKNLNVFYNKIVESYNFLISEVDSSREVIPCARWLLDNLYLIQREYKDIKDNMPDEYYRSLPIINRGFMKGYPRIYYIAVEMLSRTYGNINEENIDTFINAYQENTILTSGELWAFPIMLRIALIQNISKIVVDMVYEQEEKDRAEILADKIINLYNRDDSHLESVLSGEKIEKLRKKKIDFTPSFTERFIKILRDNFVENSSVYKWIDEELARQDKTFDMMINIDHQKQSNFQISISNSFTSIRKISSFNWNKNFERFSYVEQVLRKDPAGVYENMDFKSRDYYRHQIERLSKKIGVPEVFIAKKALKCAEDAMDDEKYKSHVGYYIIDEGISCVMKHIAKEKAGKGHWSFGSRHNIRLTENLYIFSIIAVTILISMVVSYDDIYSESYNTVWRYIITFFLMLIPASEIFISIFNWSINRLTHPRFIPKLELKNGIQEEFSTAVVIPAIFNDVSRIKSLIDEMEVYYLSNEEDNLYFILLGDFCDSDSKVDKNDKFMVNIALEMMRKLNEKYSKNGKDKFYFLSRYRKYNKRERKWMGWERKRGKLMEFNYLIRGCNSTSYNVISGNIKNLYKVKYVITLDADTQLPKDTAKILIGAMEHILNIPHIQNGKVTRGHGLMQPRVSVGTLSANKTLYSSIFSGETGIDMYTNAVSDVYEDLFDEGIFTGKGIYNVDTFISMLKDKIPENSILSHDLLEGSYVRTALVTDVEFIDGYPAYYNSSSKRIHRWVRGDWQLLPWIFKKNDLNRLSRWKIFDNLRRSLVTPFIIALIFWSLLSFKNPEKGLVISLVTLICPVFFNVSDSVVLPSKGISLSGRIDSFKRALEQFLLIFIFLPYKAYLMMDAVIRTLYRMFISKIHMLQWQTAEDAEIKSGKSPMNYVKTMYMGSVIGVAICILAFQNSKIAGILLLPSCIVWFLSPYIAYRISLDKKSTESNLKYYENRMLREIARRTWAYFEDFVTEDTNWLAPDNYQECPYKGLAYRTSPTNMAMGITSNAVAYDLGYITLDKFYVRMERTISSMEILDRYKGHFYNWYDIKAKKPLSKYISTVDSGNLVCYIWLVEESIYQYLKAPILNKDFVYGLKDTLKLADDEIESIYNVKDVYSENIEQITKDKVDIHMIKFFLKNLREKSDKILIKVDNLYWSRKVKNMAEDFINFINKYVPWIDSKLYSTLEDNTHISYYIVEKLNKIIYDIPIKNVPDNITSLIQYIDTNVGECIFCSEIKECLNSSIQNINSLISGLENILNRLRSMDSSHDFRILYNVKRELFSIGYNVDKNCQDKSYYDLLASEARQASFAAIAKGQIDQNHWFKLGRSMALVYREKLLVSWSGTMFEYLMPLIIMKNFPNTLLFETYKAIVNVQKAYGKKNDIPWGISECAYYNFDADSTYQYKAIGVPGVALDRNAANEIVIAPYASVMALQIDKGGAIENIKKLISDGAKGKYGFYESMDYNKNKIVQCFMVHHQGMSFMSIDNVLKDNILQNRFHSVPRVKSVELLLQEKVPNSVVYNKNEKNRHVNPSKEYRIIMPQRKYTGADTSYPETNIISNENYSVMITNSGSGYSKKGDMMIYRWREDCTEDDTGMFFYIKNINSNDYWSAAYEPCKYEGENYKVIFSEDKVEFERKDGNIKTYTEITVSQEDNAEIRKISITNNSNHTREVEVTSYMEVTLTPYAADLVHPIFSNLFIQTEFLEDPSCLIASRRPRIKNADKNWLVQTISVDGTQVGTIQYETSRENFIGRNRDMQNPRAMDNDASLTGTTGGVIDPIISLRVRVKIESGKTCKVAYATAVSNSREKVVEFARKYRNMDNVDREFQMSTNAAYMQMKYLGLKASRINIYQKMASRILFINENMKKRSGYIVNMQKYQSTLWAYGISGDLPIVFLIIRGEKDISLVRQILNAHEYFGIKGLKTDLVVLNLEDNSYLQSFQNQIRELVDSSNLRNKQGQSGGVFIYNSENMKSEDINLLKAIAKLVIDSKDGDIIEQLGIDTNSNDKHVQHNGINHDENNSFTYGIDSAELQYFNELGGFSKDGRSYIIILKDYNNTPAPWINVISNKHFGFHVSEAGMGYTWNENSRENKLTSWTNDSVVDGESEALYLKDKESGRIWSISPKPVRDSGEYIIEHDFGYSVFKHTVDDISGEMTMFVDMDESLKLCSIKLRNNSQCIRRLSVTYYAKLVLGVTHEQTAQYLFTGVNNEDCYIYARNPYNEYFGKNICYLSIVGGEKVSYTGDRAEFIGRGSSIKNPEGLYKNRFSNTVGAGFDPCFAESVDVTLEPGTEKYLLVLFGQGKDHEDIKRVIRKYNNVEKSRYELDRCKNFWNEFLGTIQIDTPDKSMDIMLNGWLMYQALGCRYWARSAFYQSGGAYGFRDQLQDVMAIGYLNPDITRQHIIYSSTRQYLEGDVQHWWHPIVESGIRTRFSDDLLWLPYVVSDYIENTGDYSILSEETTYLQDDELKEDEDERYSISKASEIKGTIYDHCIRAIKRALKFGDHNIPLMGSGDWNDGMSTVGNEGRGESVWLGWFLYNILDKFIPICNYMNDKVNSEDYAKMKEFIRDNLEKNSWDGSWYRRAYFDDGTPLGSIENDECRIDCIAQAWSVISKAAKESRAREALEALDRNLVKRDKGMVLLLTPAFNKSNLEPGYIKGYLPGIRENGGQYTHGAIWAIIAFAEMGYNNKAYEIFSMLNPINHSKSYLNCRTYKLEPYVIAADIYASKNNEGRGGWSWYTGAAGWMYKAGIESILGVKFKGQKGFTIEPCIPVTWSGYNMKYRRGKCLYNIEVQKDSSTGIWLDGNRLENNIIPFLNEGIHKVIVKIYRI